jgi:predicted ATPase
MIQKIAFENYKAFKKGEIKLKPITILLGANSVGKSSIINLLLMLQQTANSANYKSALRLHGENVSMGECKNIFRNQITSNDIIIDFEFKNGKLKELLKKELFNDFIGQVFQPIQFISRFPEEETKQIIDIDFSLFINKRGKIDEKLYYSKETFQKAITIIESFNKSMSENRKQPEQDTLRSIYLKYSESFIINYKEALERIYDFFVEVKKIKEDLFNLSFKLCNVKSNEGDVLKMREVSLINNKKQILNIKFDLSPNNNTYKDIKITSDFTNGQELLYDKTKAEFLKLINFNSTIFSWTPNYNKNRDFFYGHFGDEEYSIVTQILIKIIEQTIVSVKRSFIKEFINHVSPLRAHPKRYYFLDKANINTTLDTLDGNSLTEVLKENTTVKNRVNTWLETFGLKVDVSTLQDIVHKLKIQQYSLDLDITDVGFGISQILPIIVQGFLSFENSLTMIEQPEIHLHPKMQADLADLFIDVTGIAIQEKLYRNEPSSTLPRKYLLVETHSEYLLRRLRRRISEGKISAQDIAIYFIVPPKDENSSAEIQEKEVSENGSFEWPQDFYAEELMKDTTEFIKQSIRRK